MTAETKMKLENRIAVITGAARGIGRACAERLLLEGAKVVIADIDEARLGETAAAIGPPSKVLAVVTDVSQKDQVEALIAAAVAKFGRLDIMVNNAGIAMVQDFLAVTKADYDKVLGVNLEGAFWGTQAAARQMIAQGAGGVIINMSSINSGLANPRVATYAITKGGMNQITGTAAVAFARNGIRVRRGRPRHDRHRHDPLRLRFRRLGTRHPGAHAHWPLRRGLRGGRRRRLPRQRRRLLHNRRDDLPRRGTARVELRHARQGVSRSLAGLRTRTPRSYRRSPRPASRAASGPSGFRSACRSRSYPSRCGR